MDSEITKMLALRKEIDPDVPDAVVFSDEAATRFNRTLNRAHKEDVINTMVQAQRLADAVIDAAIDWHKSDMDESMDAAQRLEDAIESLLECRRKMPIVKDR